MARSGIAALARAIGIIGNQTATAAVVKRTPQAVSEIVRRGKAVPAEWCLPIEEATQGQVTRQHLRPDLFGEPSAAAA